MLSGGLVVAKRANSCNRKDIRRAWDATCGNVAFMRCDLIDKMDVDESFEVCLAGFPNRKLVYDKHERYFSLYFILL